MSHDTTAAAEITVEELQRKAAEARARAASTTTSGERRRYVMDAPEVPTEEKTCPACQLKYEVVKLPSGNVIPATCPRCLPVATLRPDVQGSDEPGGYRGSILEDLDRAGVNVPKYKAATFETFDPDPDAHVLELADQYIEAWRASMNDRWPARDWMYLYGAGSAIDRGRAVPGGKGNGKTFLAIAFARGLIQEGLLDPRRFRFATAETILLESEATFRSNGEDSEIRLLSRYASCDLLIIDDLGVRLPSPHALRLFDELTKRREAKGTIWTSNLSVRVIAQQAPELERITSRIAGECGDGGRYILEFRGPDRRLARSRRQPAAAGNGAVPCA